MKTDELAASGGEAGAVHYEKLARKLLSRQLREFRGEYLAPAAVDLEHSVGEGDVTTEQLSAFASNTSEYAEVSADILSKTRDMRIQDPPLLLYMHGGEVFRTLAKAGGWFALDDNERQSTPRTEDGLPPRGPPERAADTLLRVWQILDDVAEVNGQPLPDDLRAPRPTDDPETVGE